MATHNPRESCRRPAQLSAINSQLPRSPEPLITTVKEMAVALKRSEDYVSNMRRGGFKLPATVAEAVAFIRAKGPPTRFRLYGHK